jgi:hypothetical protein
MHLWNKPNADRFPVIAVVPEIVDLVAIAAAVHFLQAFGNLTTGVLREVAPLEVVL